MDTHNKCVTLHTRSWAVTTPTWICALDAHNSQHGHTWLLALIYVNAHIHVLDAQCPYLHAQGSQHGYPSTPHGRPAIYMCAATPNTWLPNRATLDTHLAYVGRIMDAQDRHDLHDHKAQHGCPKLYTWDSMQHTWTCIMRHMVAQETCMDVHESSWRPISIRWCPEHRLWRLILWLSKNHAVDFRNARLSWTYLGMNGRP